MTLIIAPKGLYLHPKNLWLWGKYAPVFVPWSQLKAPRPGHIYLGWQAMELSIGDHEVTTVTFPLNLYRQMTVYLEPKTKT